MMRRTGRGQIKNRPVTANLTTDEERRFNRYARTFKNRPSTMAREILMNHIARYERRSASGTPEGEL